MPVDLPEPVLVARASYLIATASTNAREGARLPLTHAYALQDHLSDGVDGPDRRVGPGHRTG